VVLLPSDWSYVSRKPDRGLTEAILLDVIRAPDIERPDPDPRCRRYYKRHVGPSTWLRVVVRYEHGEGRVYNAFPNRKLPMRDRT
jgi:hypothetical protein